MHGLQSDSGALDTASVEEIISAAASEWLPSPGRVLLVIPDGTRTCPMDALFPLLYRHIAPRSSVFNVLVALGTHPPMPQDMILQRVGISPQQQARLYPKASFHNHSWKDPAALASVGRLKAAEIKRITDGMFEMDVEVTVNRMVLEHDLVILCGPVFPHEVVGFSGGNKYLFPGIAGGQIIDFFHWLGAVITNLAVIGRKHTPVRKVVDMAASLVPAARRAFCMVVRDGGLAGFFAGEPEEAWSEAADLSSRIHIVCMPRSYHTVLSCAPSMYDDLWTGGKCMYKLEPVVADGGTLIIYAPHITEVSVTHGAHLLRIGYHVRDFFLKQWNEYKDFPWGVLAHSTHVKGAGTWENGVETPRINVVLATGIPEHVCRRINLGYMDVSRLRISDYEGRENEGVLCVRKAGEILYRPAASAGGRSADK